MDPEVVAAPVEPEPVVGNSGPTRQRNRIVRYGVDEQFNMAEEVIASALCAAELEGAKDHDRSQRAL